MKRTISMLAAAAVILYLPESNRLDLLTVALIVYACSFYVVRCLCGVHERMQDERRWLKNLRWVRRNPPALVDLSGKTEWPVIMEEPGYVLFQWIGGADNASHVS